MLQVKHTHQGTLWEGPCSSRECDAIFDVFIKSSSSHLVTSLRNSKKLFSMTTLRHFKKIFSMTTLRHLKKMFSMTSLKHFKKMSRERLLDYLSDVLKLYPRHKICEAILRHHLQNVFTGDKLSRPSSYSYNRSYISFNVA